MAIDIQARGLAQRANSRITGVEVGGAPYIGDNNNWYIWNSNTSTYEDSGILAEGTNGVGVPSGGNEGQFLMKDSSDDYDTSWAYVPDSSTAFLDFDCTLSGTEIVGSLEQNISDFELVPNHEYIFNLSLPITTLTGDLNNDYTITLLDRDNNDVVINCIFQQDITQTSTVRDLCTIQNYNAETGYSWSFQGYYREISNDGTIYRLVYTSDVVRESNPSMSGEEIYTAVINSSLKPGTTVICMEDYSENGFSYLSGHAYKILGEWLADELHISTSDISISAASEITYDNETSNLTATNVQDAVDELVVRSIPTTSLHILGDETNFTIDEEGKYLFFGDVGTLTITATTSVSVIILGSLGILNLPETSKTVTLTATNYTGLEINTANSGALSDGSIVGKYQIRATDVQ